MRFHIGFSKFIKPSKLLHWLSIAFLGLLAWLGLTQQEVFASQTFEDFKLCSYVDPNYDISYSEYRAGTITHSNKYTYNSTTVTYVNQCDNSDPVRDYSTVNQYFSSVLIAVGPNANANENVWQSFKVPINYTFCSNVADTNSLDLFIPFRSSSIDTINTRLSNSYFNNYYSQITSLSDLVSVYVTPHYSNDIEPLPSYACHIDSNDNSSQYYNITCIGIPYDNTVTSYSLDFYNNAYQTFENKDSVYYVNSSIGADDLKVNTSIALHKYIDYQCSYVEPVQPDEPLFPEDSTGSSSIETSGSSGGHCFGDDCASSTVNQSDLFISWINELDINEGLQDLLTLPKNIIDVVVSESGNSCSPLSINFSSITQTFGGFNYSLQIPCMRTVLSNLLDYEIFNGVTIYNLFDLLMGFGLLIVFANRFHGAINNILSGDSLSEYTDL